MSLCLQPVDLNKLGWTTTRKDDESIANGFNCVSPELATPLEKLTTKSVTGTGAFDVLMQAAKAHLTEEYDNGRITGKEYSTVYLGALTAVLQTATQFLLNEQQVQKINAEIGLVRQQTVTELTNTCDNIPVGLGFNYIPDDPCCIKSIVPDNFSCGGGSSYGGSYGGY
jgi:hypothetical protein